MPHITFASIEGEASTVTPGAVTITEAAGSTPPYPPVDTQFNLPVPIQTSITAGLRYEVNDSAALKIEYQVIDVNQDPDDLADANEPFNQINYGLFNTNFNQSTPQNDIGIISVALDVIF